MKKFDNSKGGEQKMQGGSILRHQLKNGIEDIWEIESIELGAVNEIGIVRMHSLTLKNTIDNQPVQIAVPSNMVTSMISIGIVEVYNRGI